MELFRLIARQLVLEFLLEVEGTPHTAAFSILPLVPQSVRASLVIILVLCGLM